MASDTAVFADVPHLAFAIAPGDGLFVVWEEVLGLNRARYLEITQGSFTAQEAHSWGAVAKVVPLDQVLPQARELAEQMTRRPHLTSKYVAVVFRQRISRRLAEGMLAGMALESLTAANLAYLPRGEPGPRRVGRQLPGRQAGGQALTGSTRAGSSGGCLMRDQRQHGIQGGLQRLGAALDLGQEQPPLQGGQCRQGQFVRVDAAKLAAGLHAPEPGADALFPAREARGDLRAGLVVGLGELAAQRSDRAAAAAFELLLVLDQELPPCPHSLQSVHLCHHRFLP